MHADEFHWLRHVSLKQSSLVAFSAARQTSPSFFHGALKTVCVENLSDNRQSGRNNVFKYLPFSHSLGQSWTYVLWTAPIVHTSKFTLDHGTKRLTWSATPTAGQNNTDQKRWCDLRERLTVSSNRIGTVSSVEGSSRDLRAPVSAPG